MSMVGFDIGNQNCAIAVPKNGGIDVLLNDESNRETPAVVSFGEKQRFLGSSGAAFATKFPKSTISQIKRLIGREYEDQSVQEDLKLLPFKISKGKHDGVLIHLEFMGKTQTFMPVEILGMLFAHLKHLADKNLEFPVEYCVIGIPSYFTDLQRREYLHAASIAGLSPLKLMHDCTAVALGYGMYKTDFSNKRPTNVVFVDIGQCDTQVTVAAFSKGKMTILAHSFDPNLGGRDFDEVLFSHFATQFKKQYNIKVYSNARASVRLRSACEKLKKVLSANEEAPLSIECLVDEKDLVGFITRKEFEKLSAKLLERVTDACRKAVTDSDLSVDKIDTIELVGSGSRIPAIMTKIASLFRKEPMRTLNGSECVARGCALYCAMLSPRINVPNYEIKDIFPYSVGLIFGDHENRRRPELTHFPKGSEFPSNKAVQYNGNITFFCEVLYTNKMDSAISPTVGRFMISPDQISGEKNVKATCTVNVKLNVHGIFEIESASFLEVMHLPTDNSYQIWPMQMVNKFIKNVAGYINSHHAVESRRSNTRGREQKLSVSENHHFLTTKDEKQNAAGYKHTDSSLLNPHHAVESRRSNTRDREQKLSVSENYHFLTTINEIQEAPKRAQLFKEQDIKVEKTKEKRNTLESFIYSTRSKLLSSYRSVATDSEVENISKILQDTEDWLYKEGDDESEQVYIRKLEDLKKLLYPIEVKYKEEKEKEEAVIALQTCIREYRLAADLPPIQKEKVNYECIQAEPCFNQLSQLQDSSTKNDTCAYSTGAIIGITQTLKRRCEGILTSKPSLLKYEEPVDSDLKQNPNDEMQVDN